MNTKSAMRKILSCLAFCGASLLGLALTFPFLGFWAMGECLPRDGSLAMKACDAAKAREFWSFVLTYIVISALAVRAIWRKDAWGEVAALCSAPIGVAVLFCVFLTQGVLD